MWNSVEAGDTNSLCSSTVSNPINEFGEITESLKDECSAEIESKEPFYAKTTFCKTFTQLDVHCDINFIDTDGEFILSAGQDHDIKVWSIADGRNVRQLRGHYGSVTGLKVFELGIGMRESPDRVVISSSKDGTIRQWSLSKGEEVRQIVTANALTSMGVLNTTLVATGNHKGHLELHHLVTGKLFAKTVAHRDPIEDLVADDIYICTAVYDRPCSLKVWMHKWGKLLCIYRLEESHKIAFTSFTLVPDHTLVLGSADRLELHILSMTSHEKYRLEFSENPGYVQHITTMEELILISAMNIDGLLQLFVYLQNGLDHLATFCCKEMDRISSIALLKYEGSLKFILGGSSLAILQLDDNESSDCLEELKNRYHSTQKTSLQGKDTLTGYLLVSHEGEERDNTIKHNAGCNLIQHKGKVNSSEPKDGLLLDKLRSLSISDNSPNGEAKYPMARGIVKLPPIRNSTDTHEPGRDAPRCKSDRSFQDDREMLEEELKRGKIERNGYSQIESSLQNLHSKTLVGREVEIERQSVPDVETKSNEMQKNGRRKQVEETDSLTMYKQHQETPLEAPERVSSNVKIISGDKQTEALSRKSRKRKQRVAPQKAKQMRNKKCCIM